MRRVCFLQQWYALSDPMAEESPHDSEAMRRIAVADMRRGRGFRSSSTSWRHYAGRRARGKRGAGRAAALQHPARRRPARLKPEREADPWH
jgi:hypothetical protein